MKSEPSAPDVVDLPDFFELGDCIIQPKLNRIRSNGTDIQVEPKTMDLLVHLASRAGRVCSRQELLDTVWHDVVVGEEVLSTAVSKLRRALGDDSRSPRYVETISRRGYRLVAEIPHFSTTTAPNRRGGEPLIPLRRMAWLGPVAVAVLVAAAAIGGKVWRNVATPGANPLYRVVPLTTQAGIEQNPTLSADGTRVAFASDNGEGGDLDIYVKQVDAERCLRLTSGDENETYPAWSPDGSRVAYVRGPHGEGEVFVVAAIGGAPRRLVPAHNVVGRVSWSPDGATIACAERPQPEQSSQIVLYRVATGARTTLTPTAPLGREDSGPVFSPDGSKIAFVRFDERASSDLYVVAASGGPARRITSAMTRVHGFDWSRDGRAIVCSGREGGVNSVWRLDPDGGEAEWLPGVGENVYDISIARNAGRMAYMYRKIERSIKLLRDVESPRPRVEIVAAGSSRDAFPSLSPDGSRLAFVSNRSGADEVWICGADGSDPYRLTSFGSGWVAIPRWSPDGNRVAFSGNAAGSADVFVVDVRNGDSSTLIESEASYDLPVSWSRDGRWLYAASNRGGQCQIWRLSAKAPDWGSAVCVTPAGGVFGEESSDGRRFYFSKLEEPGLWSVPLGGDSTTAVALDNAPPVVGTNMWCLTEGGIFAITGDAGDAKLVLYDIDTTTQRIVAPANDADRCWVTADAGGDVVVYVTERLTASDLMLVEGF